MRQPITCRSEHSSSQYMVKALETQLIKGESLWALKLVCRSSWRQLIFCLSQVSSACLKQNALNTTSSIINLKVMWLRDNARIIRALASSNSFPTKTWNKLLLTKTGDRIRMKSRLRNQRLKKRRDWSKKPKRLQKQKNSKKKDQKQKENQRIKDHRQERVLIEQKMLKWFV